MKLWIRTQDKKALLECEYVRVEELKETHINNFNSIAVNQVSVGAAIIIEGVMVAKYNSLQRAMQILDEIQTLLINKKKTETTVRDCVVYELPKE